MHVLKTHNPPQRFTLNTERSEWGMLAVCFCHLTPRTITIRNKWENNKKRPADICQRSRAGSWRRSFTQTVWNLPHCTSRPAKCPVNLPEGSTHGMTWHTVTGLLLDAGDMDVCAVGCVEGKSCCFQWQVGFPGPGGARILHSFIVSLLHIPDWNECLIIRLSKWLVEELLMNLGVLKQERKKVRGVSQDFYV